MRLAETCRNGQQEAHTILGEIELASPCRQFAASRPAVLEERAAINVERARSTVLKRKTGRRPIAIAIGIVIRPQSPPKKGEIEARMSKLNEPTFTGSVNCLVSIWNLRTCGG